MKENLVLIGMPGSGKTTIGQILSKQLDLEFVDVDIKIEEYTKQSIPSLFEKGEEYFRTIETEVTKMVSKITPVVIATGGGIVLREANIEALRKNGIIVFLNRSIENIINDLDINTRPLLKNDLNHIHTLYNKRIDLYYHYADLVIENNEKSASAIKQIMSQLTLKEGKEF